MKEEWLMPGSVIPVDVETTAALVAEIKRLIGVVGNLALRQALLQPKQEQYATKVVATHEDGTYTTERIPLPKREWVGLTKDEIHEMIMEMRIKNMGVIMTEEIFRDVEAKLKEKNGGQD